MHARNTTYVERGDKATLVPFGSPEIPGAGAGQRHMQSMADRPDLLPVEPDLCELTGLSAQTVRGLINSGSLPGCRIGRRLYVPKAHFLAYIEKGGGL